MQSLKVRFEEHVFASTLFTRDDSLLLAMSGGLDSTVLATLLHSLNFSFAVAHVSYGLRGKESMQDAKFVQQWCSDRGIAWHCYEVQLSDWEIEKGSIQMKARTIRYRWFHAVAKKYGYTKILTAHHADDSIETILMRLFNGGEIRSLMGIPAARGILRRPFLPFYRIELHAFALASGVEWRDDSSNQKKVYRRNVVRNQLLPAMAHIFPGLRTHIQALPEKLEPALYYLNQAYNEFLTKHVTHTSNGFQVAFDALQHTIGKEEFLYRLLKPCGFTFDQCVEVLRSPVRTGAVWKSERHHLLIDRAQLIVEPLPTNTSRPELCILRTDSGEAKAFDRFWQWFTYPIPALYTPSVGFTVDLDADLLHLPLEVTKWYPGDRMVPLGMVGSVKVSDYLINKKVTRFEKDRTLVVRHGTDIVWLVGHIPSHIFRITSSTLRIFTLRCSSISPTPLQEVFQQKS